MPIAPSPGREGGRQQDARVQSHAGGGRTQVLFYPLVKYQGLDMWAEAAPSHGPPLQRWRDSGHLPPSHVHLLSGGGGRCLQALVSAGVDRPRGL